MTSVVLDAPRFERVRHDVRVRRLTVTAIEMVTPKMRRIRFGGKDLADFASRGFDDHVKLLIPVGGGEVERRDYTVRSFDPSQRSLALDFALHEAGPATWWAGRARVGDTLEVAGPKGSRIAPRTIRSWFLVGDETALPAIGRLVDEAGPDMAITSLVAVQGPEEEQAFAMAEKGGQALWVHRPLVEGDKPDALLAILNGVAIEPDTMVWIAAEATVARSVRDHLAARGQPQAWLRAAGYWVAGRANAHLKLDHE